ncbi:hypothetical protein [Haliangium ochraceum]|uniref:Lipoprotein n=1 Tax=Haliangium ochraceum (strain DSM 14365 / JCM 11303 / SMP-2) TaxID=502025 RepID=D0LR63_HALO1|nr:hypothetical protein [Haliangium ochraceum]ACY15571.1 hypothetical protein Hoch_3065 [Haliangium ochraceum DSM 14365]
MRRIAAIPLSLATALAIALALVIAAPLAHADGLDIGYGDECWSDSGDADQDGLSDGCEQALASWFMPMLWFDSGESGYARRPYFAVKNLSFAARTVQILYLDTYYDDTGVLTGHDGDPEFQIAEVHYSGGRWYLDWMYLSAHRKSSCDSSAWYSYAQLEYDTADAGNDYRGWPTLYVAEDKHATYNNLSTCDAGCYLQDYCSRYRLESLDPAASLSGRNVGSTSVPLIDRVDLGGKTEYLLRDREFTGWGNQWYRPNSQGYRRHLDDFGF